MLIPYNSKVPVAVDRLLELLRARADGTGVTVRDGPWVEGGPEPEVIVVGWTGFFSAYQYPRLSQSEDLGSGAVMANAALDGLGGGIRETFSINCASLVRRGDNKDFSAARTKAYANTALVADVVGPPWIGGTVMKAVFGTGTQMSYTQDRRGILVVLVFAIDCVSQASQ